MTPEKPLMRFTSHYDGNENRTLMTPSERGDWVHFWDVELLVKAVREARVERDEAYQERADWMHSLDRSKADIITLMHERDESRSEVERLRALIDTVIRNCMECYDKRECQSCAWLREGTEKKG